jgi:hypothetical protein
MDMLKTSQQTGLCRCGNKAEMQSRRQSLTMRKHDVAWKYFRIWRFNHQWSSTQ